GDAVTPHYDALLAKVVAHGADRAQALARLARAVDEFAVSGVATTLPFHRRLVHDAGFRAGRYDTGVVDALLGGDAPPPEALAAELAALRDLAPRVAGAVVRGGPGALELDAGDGPRRVAVQEADGVSFEVALDEGSPERLEIREVGPGLHLVRDAEGGIRELAVDRQGGRVAVVAGPFTARYRIREPEDGA
ncbi:MAG: hypothetical protein R3263_06105, partial [Myxococcota bacterium]|nr:hypothetical protein [Myxococcota bacterium]